MLEWLYSITGGKRTTPSELRANLVKAGVMTDTPAGAAARPWNDIAVQPTGTAAATMGPGDTLVITCERPLNREQVDTYKALILADLPAGCKVVVLFAGHRVGAVVQARRKPVIPQPQ